MHASMRNSPSTSWASPSRTRTAPSLLPQQQQQQQRPQQEQQHRGLTCKASVTPRREPLPPTSSTGKGVGTRARTNAWLWA